MHVQDSMSVIQKPPVSVFYFYCFLFMFTSFYDPSLSIHFSVSWFAGKSKVNMQTLSSFIPNCQSHKTKQKTSFILCQFFFFFFLLLMNGYCGFVIQLNQLHSTLNVKSFHVCHCLLLDWNSLTNIMLYTNGQNEEIDWIDSWPCKQKTLQTFSLF